MLTIPTLAVEMAKKLPVSTLPPASGTTWCMRSVPPMQPTRQLNYLLLNHVRYCGLQLTWNTGAKEEKPSHTLSTKPLLYKHCSGLLFSLPKHKI